jgi:hypothetical protein
VNRTVFNLDGKDKASLNLESQLEIAEFYFAYRRDPPLVALLDCCLARLGCSLSRLGCCLHWFDLFAVRLGSSIIGWRKPLMPAKILRFYSLCLKSRLTLPAARCFKILKFT